jgi:hypothetical protein
MQFHSTSNDLRVWTAFRAVKPSRRRSIELPGRDHIGEALQFCGKVFPAVLAEGEEPFPLRFKYQRDHLIDQRFARRGQLDPHRASVLRFWESRDQVQRFETVQSAGETGTAKKQ